jgi:hypothetical protein
VFLRAAPAARASVSRRRCTKKRDTRRSAGCRRGLPPVLSILRAGCLSGGRAAFPSRNLHTFGVDIFTEKLCAPVPQGRMIVARSRFRGRACALRNKCRVKENSIPSALPKARAQRSGAREIFTNAQEPSILRNRILRLLYKVIIVGHG